MDYCCCALPVPCRIKNLFPVQQVKMPVGKDLCPPLTTRIMPSHLAAVAAAAAAVGSAFPLRACHNPALFQTQSLPAALLRPAPGPIRTAHTPVLFAPYWPLNYDFRRIGSLTLHHLILGTQPGSNARYRNNLKTKHEPGNYASSFTCDTLTLSYKCIGGDLIFVFFCTETIIHHYRHLEYKIDL